MRKRRYEMLLPLKFNDGRVVPAVLFDQSREQLIAQFGAISIEPGILHGTWVHEGHRYEDELLRWVVDVEDSPDCEQFFVGFKQILLERFDQIEIYIVSYPIDIV